MVLRDVLLWHLHLGKDRYHRRQHLLVMNKELLISCYTWKAVYRAHKTQVVGMGIVNHDD